MKETNEELIKRLIKIEEELKKGQAETATTLVEKQRKPLFRMPFFLRSGAKKSFIYAMIILLTICLIVVGVSKLMKTQAEPIVEKGTFIEQIQDLSSLATAQAYVKAVLQKEDNQLFGKPIDKNFPGTKRKVLFIVPSSVVAGIDLQTVNESDLKINEEDKTLEISLPHAKILQDPVLYLDEIQTFSQEGLFRSEMDIDEGFVFAAEANEIVIQEAVDQGLLKVAEENAERTFTQFFSQLGYKVKVQFHPTE